MALIKCEDCGKDFSDAAAACPNCGRPNKPPAPTKRTGGGNGCLIVIGIFAMMIGGVAFVGTLQNWAGKTQPRETTITGTGNKAHDMLQAQSEERRRELLYKVLRSAGEQCDFVASTFFQGMAKDGGAFWNARCGDDSRYSIVINSDATGSTKTMDCALLKAVAKVECFTKF